MREKLARLDGTLCLIALSLCAIGLLNVYSGTRVLGGRGIPLYSKQAIWLLLGIGVFFSVYLVGDGFLEETSWFLYFLVLLLLVVVLIAGKVRGGAQRWISFGGFNLQPSELAKIALILALATFFSSRYTHAGLDLFDTLPSIGIAAPPFLLVALQPDLGTAGVLLLILAGMMVIACVRTRVFVLLGVLAAGGIPVLWFLMREYQKQRVLTLLDPERDPLGAGYHVIQSKIAVGSGGLFGKGYLEGTQGSLRFLPEQHTDFAFGVFAEEWGFLGSLVLIALFLGLCYRGFFLASRCQDRFAAFACGGITAFFLVHVVVNTMMVCGLFPVVGIPLPFVSYGGSSMVTNMLALGVLSNLARSRFTFQRRGERLIAP
ncbi:MAG TPA: rod shape-determining protein RodA [Deltaproteobacteria bacterium]|nr:MAG: rod shape-determining protein RodA [Deltaproteobacteria bacterium GWC2_65_14]HBO70668.1 rod shape-determining protein RodA [Deltaproteobacteria bacterium]